MIVVTGAAGFIGSVLTGRLNHDGLKDLVLVDDWIYGFKPVAEGINCKYPKLKDDKVLAGENTPF